MSKLMRNKKLNPTKWYWILESATNISWLLKCRAALRNTHNRIPPVQEGHTESKVST